MIAELKKLEAAATGGPWASPGTDGGDRVISYHNKNGRRRTLAHAYTGKNLGGEANAALIVALRNSAKKMIAVVEAADNRRLYDTKENRLALLDALRELEVGK